jgi:hypothetical protein
VPQERQRRRSSTPKPRAAPFDAIDRAGHGEAELQFCNKVLGVFQPKVMLLLLLLLLQKKEGGPTECFLLEKETLLCVLSWTRTGFYVMPRRPNQRRRKHKVSRSADQKVRSLLELGHAAYVCLRQQTAHQRRAKRHCLHASGLNVKLVCLGNGRRQAGKVVDELAIDNGSARENNDGDAD